MEIDKKKTVKVDVKELRIHMKVCDTFQGALHDAQGEQVCNQDDGYVPSLMPGEHYGDYLILNIDIETGQITNWKKPSVKQVKEFVAKCNGDEDDS